MWAGRVRLSLDLEKLLSDPRSLLHDLYRLTLCFQADKRSIPTRRQQRFGKFSGWYEQQHCPPFLALLSTMCELVPWVLDIRELRDGYVHRAHQSLVFPGEADLCIDPWAHLPRPRARSMPDVFYVGGNANNIVLVEKFLVFIIAPVLVLRNALASGLVELLVGARRRSPAARMPASSLKRCSGVKDAASSRGRMRACGWELPAAAFAWRLVRCLAGSGWLGATLYLLTTRLEFEMTNAQGASETDVLTRG
jgi:hypothetical protein